jgi:8-oxo-dGTP pyrophosphatase MutT (NUDIX family)
MPGRRGRGPRERPLKDRPAPGTRGKTPVATQVSSGGVIYREQAGAVEVALIAYTGRGGGRVWCLPKGGVEPNESLEQTARREVTEETGLSGEVEAKLGAIQYWYYGRQERVRYHKSVHFYLLRFSGGRLEDHDREAEEVRWFPIGAALEALTYENERAILTRASAAIQDRQAGGPAAEAAEAAGTAAGGRATGGDSSA